MRTNIRKVGKIQNLLNQRLIIQLPSTEKNLIRKIERDANNLYGWAMSQHLPICGFHWLNCDEIDSFNVNQIGDTDDVGYILEGDLGKTYVSHFSKFSIIIFLMLLLLFI